MHNNAELLAKLMRSWRGGEGDLKKLERHHVGHRSDDDATMRGWCIMVGETSSRSPGISVIAAAAITVKFAAALCPDGAAAALRARRRC